MEAIMLVIQNEVGDKTSRFRSDITHCMSNLAEKSNCAIKPMAKIP